MTLGVLLVCLPLLLEAQEVQWASDYRRGIEARQQGRYSEAIQLLEGALASGAQDASQDLRRADIRAALATIYQTLGEPEKAERNFLEAQATLGSRHTVEPALGSVILLDLGAYRAGQGRLKDAETLLDQAVASSVRAFGEQHTYTAIAKTTLAQVYLLLGRLAEAKPLLESAVRINEAMLPAANLDRIASETALATLYAAEGRHSTALEIHQRVSEAMRKLGDQSPRFAESLVNLADLHRIAGTPERGEPLLRKALAIYEASVGADSPRVAETLLNMSIDAISQRKLSLAERDIGRALSILRRTRGPLHTTVAIGEYQLAQAYALQGKYAEAKLLLEHALPIQERTYPLGHPVIADCLFALADLATLLQRYTEAEWYCQRAIAVYETSVGASYPGLANVLRHYAKLLRMNRSAEARALENRANELQRAARSSK